MSAAIKTALRMLIREIGGVEAAASVVSRAVSIVSDWQNHARAPLPSLEQVLALEAVAPHPRVTEAMARASGHRLQAVPANEGEAPDIVHTAGGLMAAAGGVAVAVGAAMADGQLSLAERATIAEQAAATRDQCEAVLAVLAGERP